MDKKAQLNSELTAACDQFTNSYLSTLNHSNLDDETFQEIYVIALEIQKTFDAFAKAINNYLK
ncbi:MAG TPA: hypothetical protein IAB39_07350 [Candidatus Onthovicinus excrementipullorum]|nr:hypothetical protein [Candidatus Onthovicinus excrementipullorum]